MQLNVWLKHTFILSWKAKFFHIAGFIQTRNEFIEPKDCFLPQSTKKMFFFLLYYGGANGAEIKKKRGKILAKGDWCYFIRCIPQKDNPSLQQIKNCQIEGNQGPSRKWDTHPGSQQAEDRHWSQVLLKHLATYWHCMRVRRMHLCLLWMLPSELSSGIAGVNSQENMNEFKPRRSALKMGECYSSHTTLRLAVGCTKTNSGLLWGPKSQQKVYLCSGGPKPSLPPAIAHRAPFLLQPGSAEPTVYFLMNYCINLTFLFR